MKFIPFERFKIITRLCETEILERLEASVEPKRFIRPSSLLRKFLVLGPSKKPYEGKIDRPYFYVSRIIGYKNSFLPMIKGELVPAARGCSVYIVMRPHLLISTFMALLLGGVLIYFLMILGSFISSLGHTSKEDPSALLVPVFLFSLIYTPLLGFFKFESIKSREFFQKLFESDDIHELGLATSRGTID